MRNASGRPLADSAWLAAHHRAKLPERRTFCKRLAALAPNSILDLGCATGLWLDELDKVLPRDCEFIGVDSDEAALAEAEKHARSWSRPTRFARVDIEDAGVAIPRADLTLLFNLSPYLADLDKMLDLLASRPGHVAVRQYDGAALRFGPMRTEERALIEQSLHTAVANSAQFRHYDLDRVFGAIQRARFHRREIDFELFARSSPFPAEFIEYYEGTLDWMLSYLSDAAAERLSGWRSERASDDVGEPVYFVEVDLVAVLS